MLMDGWKDICITVAITCKLYRQCINKNYILLENTNIGRLSWVLAAIYWESRGKLRAFRFKAGYFAEITYFSRVKKKGGMCELEVSKDRLLWSTFRSSCISRIARTVSHQAMCFRYDLRDLAFAILHLGTCQLGSSLAYFL
jgi:uncharacterized protein YrrD